MKLLIAAFSTGIVTLGFVAISDTGGLAAVVTGANNQADKCIEAVNTRDGLELNSSDYEVRYDHVNSGGGKDVIIKNVNEEYCGSVGCVFEICLVDDSEVELISFSYAGERLEVLDSLSNNMHDLLLEGNNDTRLTWDYSRYVRTTAD